MEDVDHRLTYTDTLEHSVDAASSTTSERVLSPGQHRLSTNKPYSHSHSSSWGLNQFLTQHERIEDIRLGSNSRAAAKVHEYTLSARLDGILTILQPTAQHLSHEVNQGTS